MRYSLLSGCIFLITKIHIPANTYKIISGIHALTLSPPRIDSVTYRVIINQKK